jgi:hypothetical protein
MAAKADSMMIPNISTVISTKCRWRNVVASTHKWLSLHAGLAIKGKDRGDQRIQIEARWSLNFNFNFNFT